MNRLWLLMAGVLLCAPSFATVPDQYLGTWILDEEATTRTIADDPNMPAENKVGWTKRMLAMKVGMRISEKSISFHGFETGPMTASVVLEEELADSTILSAVILDPDRKEEIELSIAMHLGDEGALNLKIRPGNDFDLLIWKRGEVGGADSSSGEAGDVIGYLDSLKTCTPGEFRFSYPGFGTYNNTIVGRDGDRCQVEIEHPEIRMSCNYSDAMIALLTSEQKYEDASNGVLQGSTDSQESKLMSEECSVR